MRDLFSVKNKVVCIMGGTGLIGSELTSGFADCGADVFVGTRSPEQHKDKAGIQYLKIDVTSKRSVKSFVSTVIERNKKIDVWINCAWPKVENFMGSIETVDENIVLKDTADHLAGFYLCCKEILPHMKTNKRGSIINFGSIYGDLSPDFRIYQKTELSSPPSYPMIKGAIHTLTKYLACYMAPFNVRVNAVCPGGVLNNQSKDFQKNYGSRIPLGRLAKKEEIFGATLFLASDASSYITGHLLNVDGGLHAW